MAATIYDIAREAKVGIGTVSRVLNNSPKVTQQTRDRVISVASRLNYQPHAFAQALARKRSNTLGAIIPFFTNYFFIEVLKGIQDALLNLGYDLILHGVNHRDQINEYIRKNLKKGRIDGLLFFSMPFPDTFVEVIKQEEIPVIVIDYFHPSFDCICVKNTEGAMVATQHLISLGHTDIGMINANITSEPAKDRLSGFKETLSHQNLQIRDEIIVSSISRKQDGFSRDSGYTSMKEILSKKVKLPTAFFVSSDIQAIGVISALAEEGIRVPDDVAVVSFDDIELARHFELTTMRQPMYDMGVMAVEKLIDRIKNPGTPPTLTTILPKLIVRKSCGARKSEHAEFIDHNTLYSSEIEK
ncbi:MAG: LacI family DNA-binding transcriptional regulator [Bacteroidota bacterium]|nr:LacI family DNA-binding transcriptional regulator [Bacteroidota bacterium]